MCGIVGSFGKPAAHELSEALNTLFHRGPDEQMIQQTANGTLGHTRLSIIDVEGGTQPISDPSGRRWLVCNGEIYNAPQLRAEFPDYPFSTRSDNEIILALYDRYGTGAINYLDGMFAFALVDGDEIFIARDPLGIKPLYYGWRDGVLHFASEIKALNGKADSLKPFPPGHWYTTGTGLVSYYDIEAVGAASRENPVAASPRAVFDTLQNAVRKRLMSDVPLGVFLSGGLDSSIISALVQQDKSDLHSFSVGFEGSDDLGYAQQMAQYLGTQHHEYNPTIAEMKAALSDVIYHLESFDPSLVRSALPNYFLSQLASEYVKVVLSGEGADELYAGYHYLKELPDEATLHDETVKLTGDLHSCNLQRCDRMSMAHGLEARVPFLDTESVRLAFALPADCKIHRKDGGETEKYILRQAFDDLLPEEVAWRRKMQFSEGAGAAHFLAEMAEEQISDREYAGETRQALDETGHQIRSKEELLNYRLFREHFPQPEAVNLVSFWPGA